MVTDGRAPGGSADRRWGARTNRKGRFPAPAKVQETALNRLSSPGSSSGRTPALTSEETYVRSVDRDLSVGPALRKQRQPRITNPGLAPEL